MKLRNKFALLFVMFGIGLLCVPLTLGMHAPDGWQFVAAAFGSCAIGFLLSDDVTEKDKY